MRLMKLALWFVGKMGLFFVVNLFLVNAPAPSQKHSIFKYCMLHYRFLKIVNCSAPRLIEKLFFHVREVESKHLSLWGRYLMRLNQ